jgi:cytochrome c oxidase cbb3-type subunit 3
MRTTVVVPLMAMALASALIAPRLGHERQPPADGQAAADPALVARGDSVFHGKLGGAICATCHGANAKGVPGMGPDLTDKVWLHGDGTVAAIQATIRAGVVKPKKSNMAMPPFGGVPLDSAKVAAVAAYVHSLGAPK